MTSQFFSILCTSVCPPLMDTLQESCAVFTFASIVISDPIWSRMTSIFPSSTSCFAFSLSASVILPSDSNPRSASAATAPNAAAYRFPYSDELGIPQVKAFLYIPEFSDTFTAVTSPSTYFLASATAKAIAPGSVTPSAGLISSRINFVSSCIPNTPFAYAHFHIVTHLLVFLYIFNSKFIDFIFRYDMILAGR